MEKQQTIDRLASGIDPHGHYNEALVQGAAHAYTHGNFRQPESTELKEHYGGISHLGPTAVGVLETATSAYTGGHEVATRVLYDLESDAVAQAQAMIQATPEQARVMVNGLEKTHPVLLYGTAATAGVTGFAVGMVEGLLDKVYSMRSQSKGSE